MLRMPLIFTCMLLCASVAQAGSFYGGPLLGAVGNHSSIAPLEGTPGMLGLRAGFDLGIQRKTGFAVEMDANTTISDGDVQATGSYSYYYDYYGTAELTPAEREAIAEQWSWGLSSVAVYGVARLGEGADGPVYFKVKAGIIYRQLTIDTGVHDVGSSTAIAAGLGFGANLGPAVRMELELATIDENMAYLELGAAYAF